MVLAINNVVCHLREIGVVGGGGKLVQNLCHGGGALVGIDDVVIVKGIGFFHCFISEKIVTGICVSLFVILL